MARKNSISDTVGPHGGNARRGATKAPNARAMHTAHFVALVIAALAVLVIAMLLFRHFYTQRPQSIAQAAGQVHIPANSNQLGTATGLSSNYTFASSNTTFSMQSILWTDGYRSISTSSLTRINGTMTNSSDYPYSVTLVVYTMDNATSASSLLSQIVGSFSSNFNASSTSESTYEQNYSYGTASTTIYTDYALAVHYNSSIAQLINVYPIYEYMRVFPFNSTVVVVSTTGYPDLNAIYSENLAESIFRSLSGADPGIN